MYQNSKGINIFLHLRIRLFYKIIELKNKHSINLSGILMIILANCNMQIQCYQAMKTKVTLINTFKSYARKCD